MSFGFLGIQFGFALQNGNVSRIFQTLGAEIDQIPILWIAAPVTGLIVQPIIGHMSDNTWGRLGRRRPFFLVGPACIHRPDTDAHLSQPVDRSGHAVDHGCLHQYYHGTLPGLLGDMLPDEQRTKGFTMQSFFIGIGAFVASWLPYALSEWFNISNTAPEGEIPMTARLSFYLGGGVFLLAVLWTVIRTRDTKCSL